MTPKQWLVRWTLLGRPSQIPIEWLFEIPQEAFDLRRNAVERQQPDLEGSVVTACWFESLTGYTRFAWWMGAQRARYQVTIGSTVRSFTEFEDALHFLRTENGA